GQQMGVAGWEKWRNMTYADAAVLGLIEGATEYLPVSSIGHTILVTHALGLDAQSPLPDANGEPIMIHDGHGEPTAIVPVLDGKGRPQELIMADDPRNPPGTGFLTLKDAVDVYNVMVQAGPIAAILVLYWRRVWSVLRGVVGRDPQGLVVCRNLVLAFLPAGMLGFLANKWIHAHLFTYEPVAAGLIAGAVIIALAEYWRAGQQTGKGPGPELHELTWQQALVIGVCQCAALWPGTSRSMMTMVGGYLVGLRPARAAEFSFLLGLLTLTAASGYEAHGHWADIRQGLPLGPMLLGVAVATVAALVTVKLFVGWLGRHGLTVFAWYRLALAAVVLWEMKG
ncbi:MAG TPA: undecaprenyl-diphosphate phosphatase, partial [Opitutales bacterium]|nr:undecaprenyl-diphosphate phosphatase [Opitutales bacterium]